MIVRLITMMVLALAVFAGTVVVSQPRSEGLRQALAEADISGHIEVLVGLRQSGDLELWRQAVEITLLTLALDSQEGLLNLTDTLLELDTRAGEIIRDLEARVAELERRVGN